MSSFKNSFTTSRKVLDEFKQPAEQTRSRKELLLNLAKVSMKIFAMNFVLGKVVY